MNEEFPMIYPRIYEYDNVFDYFLTGEVLGACYWHSIKTIYVWSYCSNLAEDLPHIGEVLHLIDHEMTHWIISVFIDGWTSDCYDAISQDIEDHLGDWCGWRRI